MLGIPAGHFAEWCLKNGCSVVGPDNDACEADFTYFVEMSSPSDSPPPPQPQGSAFATGFPGGETRWQREICELRAQLALRDDTIARLEAEIRRLTGNVGADEGAITLPEIDAAHPFWPNLRSNYESWKSFFEWWIARGREEPGHPLVPTREDFRHHRFPSDARSRMMYALLSLMRKGDKETLTHIFGTPSADTLQDHLAWVLRHLHIDVKEMLTGSVEALQAFVKALLPGISIDNPVEGWYDADAAYVEAAFATGPRQEINAELDLSAIRLSAEMSQALAKSPRLFLEAAADRDLVKACHVVIFVPLAPELPHFVVRMQMSGSGAHTPEIERGVAQTIANGVLAGLKPAGRGNDGERSHYDILIRHHRSPGGCEPCPEREKQRLWRHRERRRPDR
jgi:hypothetical protein